MLPVLQFEESGLPFRNRKKLDVVRKLSEKVVHLGGWPSFAALTVARILNFTPLFRSISTPAMTLSKEPPSGPVR